MILMVFDPDGVGMQYSVFVVYLTWSDDINEYGNWPTDVKWREVF